MHFEESAFSKNGQPTITPKQGGVSTCIFELHSIGNILLKQINNDARSNINKTYYKYSWCTIYCSETNSYITSSTGLKYYLSFVFFKQNRTQAHRETERRRHNPSTVFQPTPSCVPWVYLNWITLQKTLSKSLIKLMRNIQFLAMYFWRNCMV